MKSQLCLQGGHFGDSNYSISKKHSRIIERTSALAKQITVYVLSCPDYVQHHLDDTVTEQVNGNIPIKTQQRVEMALSLFPGAKVEVLIADSEVEHEGKVKNKVDFLDSINTTKLRVQTRYPNVEASTFFEKSGGDKQFLRFVEHFYGVLRPKVKLNFEPISGREIDRKLSTLLEYQRSGTGGRLAGRGINISPEMLANRILKNSFAEMLTVGELIRAEHSSPDGTCTAAIVFDQSEVTGLINDGDKHGSKLKRGLSPVPLILANSASTV